MNPPVIRVGEPSGPGVQELLSAETMQTLRDMGGGSLVAVQGISSGLAALADTMETLSERCSAEALRDAALRQFPNKRKSTKLSSRRRT